MNAEKMQQFKQILQKERQAIDGTLTSMKQNGRGEQDKYSPTELSNYDNHPAELASEMFQTEFNNALKVHEEHLLYDIDHAMKKIDSGKYGECEFCGQDINEERLEVIPYTRLCMECESSKPIKNDYIERQRPNEELVLDAPLGRKYLNEREDDEHEGMDYFYDLENYGSSDSPQDMGGYHDYRDFYTNKTDHQGVVDEMDKLSNEYYRKQLR